VANYTCGNPWLEGPQTKIDCVLWRAEFEDARTFNNQKMIYLFQTTRRTWKAWIPGKMDIIVRIKPSSSN
jgi:hypothetical protein